LKNFFVTASHAVAALWQNGQPLTESITFVPAMFGGSSLLGPTWTAKVINIAAWDEVTDVVGYDMAIRQLDQPFGEWLGYFGTRGYDEDWEDNPGGNMQAIVRAGTNRATSSTSRLRTTMKTITTRWSWRPTPTSRADSLGAALGHLQRWRTPDHRGLEW
jgi:hypothetical protein